MLNIIRNLVICQPTNIYRLNSIVRLTNSLQQKHKEHTLKREDFFIDPNLKLAFEKIKKGDFIPPIISNDPIKQYEKVPLSNNLKQENTREHILGKLVYVGKLDKPFKAAKSLSLASSLGGAMCYPIMLPKILEEASIFIAIGYTIISATFVLLTPTLIQLICKRYLTSIYYHEQTGEFTGFYKNFFMMKKQMKFRPEDVQVPPITGMFTSMLIKNKPYFINHDDFYDKKLLMKMLGYDKEFDFSKYTKDIQINTDDDDHAAKKRT